MEPGDSRFGFSVIGGVDEGFLPRVDDVARGINGFFCVYFLKFLYFKDVLFIKSDVYIKELLALVGRALTCDSHSCHYNVWVEQIV